MKPALKAFGVSVGLSCKLKLNTFLYHKCRVSGIEPIIEELKCPFFFSILVCRALNPALKVLVLFVCRANTILNTILFNFV